ALVRAHPARGARSSARARAFGVGWALIRCGWALIRCGWALSVLGACSSVRAAFIGACARAPRYQHRAPGTGTVLLVPEYRPSIGDVGESRTPGMAPGNRGRLENGGAPGIAGVWEPGAPWESRRPP